MVGTAYAYPATGDQAHRKNLINLQPVWLVC